jgi:MYXO-CTERM domain-containing protein
MRARHLGLGLGLVLLAACGSSGLDEHDGPDAATPATATTTAATRRDPWQLVRATSALRARLVDPRAISRVGERFEPAAAKPRAGWQPLGGAPKVSFPATASGAMRLAVSEDVWIELTPEDVAAAPGDTAEGALVYRGVQPDVDAVHVATGERVEELRVFHAPRAEVRASWRIASGPGVREVRVRERLVEVVDAQGRVRLATEKAFAVDAAGERRDAEIAVAAGRLSASVDARGMRGEVVLDPSWVAVANMNVARRGMPLLRMSDGRYLVAGGYDGTSMLSSAEVFDPVSNAWTLTAMRTVHFYNWPLGAVELPDGRVLVAGGYSASSTPSAAAETLSPTTMTWTPVSPMKAARTEVVLTRLKSGKILVTGGASGTSGATVEIFDSTSNTWTSYSGPAGLAVYHTVVALPNGNALVAGDNNAWLFNAGSNTFGAAQAMPAGHYNGTFGGLTSDGRVLVVGNGTSPSLYDPTLGSWTSTGPMAHSWAEVQIAVLPDASLVTFQGPYYGAYVGNRYDSSLDMWSDVPVPAAGIFGTTVAAPWGLFAVGSPGVASTQALKFLSSPSGAGCSDGSTCLSGSCVDGVCCDTACNLPCQACNESGKAGTCSIVSGSPRGTRTCNGTGSCAGACNGVSAICTYPNTSTPCGTASCASGTATSTGTCNGTGTCNAPAAAACAPFACGATACKTSCATSADCAATAYCDSGTAKCVAKKSGGAMCGNGSECASTFCVDGVCCDRACNGTCEACGATGVCANVTGLPKAGHGSCNGTGPCAGSCSGASSACGYPGSSTSCGSPSCSGSTATLVAACDGAGTCGTASTSSCAPYVCGGLACKSSCSGNGDCSSGNVCTGGACVTAPVDAGVDSAVDTGAPDTGAPDSGSPDTGALDTGTADTGAPDTGTPDLGVVDVGTPSAVPPPIAATTFSKCVADGDCATGHCADGVCCNTACKEHCHSCALPGAPGVCTPEPAGVDLRAECGAAGTCVGTCSGKDDGSCAGSGPGTVCERNRCTSPSTGLGSAVCSGASGTCQSDKAIAFDCAPYICEGAFGACRSTCNTSTDCAQGFTCEVATGHCITPSVAPPDAGGSGGCDVSSTGARSQAGLALGAIALALAARRRARRG